METSTPATPWHLWAVGIVSLLWNAVGGLDYTITQTRNAAYMAQVMPDQMSYLDTLPAWMIAAWAIGVWCAVLGSILLLLRSRWAVPVFALSLAGLIVTQVQQGTTPGSPMRDSAGAIGFAVFLFVVALALLLYARAMAKRGVLR
jgi:hypothetical protein